MKFQDLIAYKKTLDLSLKIVELSKKKLLAFYSDF